MTDATDTYLLLRAFVDELHRCGLAGACTSPGSRSTPLVLSLVRDGRFPTWSHIDERVAGFFALGAAKRSGRPVAIACTSGTAAAHYAPAVIEAHEARIPLIVLTADRPPELREVGAGQTIDQLKLYGSAAKWFFEVGTHEATPERLRWIRGLACRAHWTAVSGRPGPVHLNFPLREPLVLGGPLPADDTGRSGGRPFVAHMRSGDTADGEAVRIRELAEAAPRGVVVAGRWERRDGTAGALSRFAARAGWPLLADPLSGARRGGAAIAHYDALLRDAGFAAGHRPEIVLRAGDLPTSKPLRRWLAGLDVRQVALDPEHALQDPDAAVSDVLCGDPDGVLRGLLGAWEQQGFCREEADWLAGWRAADANAAGAIEDALGDDLSEPGVARELAALGDGVTIFTASSMPVRDVETFWPVCGERGAPRVLAHRGANGIDGTVAAAFGAAAAGGGPVVLHIGDVALTHDIGALLCASRLGLAIAIVLVDNAGGGIFDFLPVAGQRDAFEEHVATPPGLHWERAAALFGCEYVSPGSPAALRDALAEAVGAPRTTIVHVRTDRSENVRRHREVWRAVAARLAAPPEAVRPPS